MPKSTDWGFFMHSGQRLPLNRHGERLSPVGRGPGPGHSDEVHVDERVGSHRVSRREKTPPGAIGGENVRRRFMSFFAEQATNRLSHSAVGRTGAHRQGCPGSLLDYDTRVMPARWAVTDAPRISRRVTRVEFAESDAAKLRTRQPKKNFDCGSIEECLELQTGYPVRPWHGMQSLSLIRLEWRRPRVLKGYT